MWNMPVFFTRCPSPRALVVSGRWVRIAQLCSVIYKKHAKFRFTPAFIQHQFYLGGSLSTFSQFLLFKVYLETISFFSIVTLTSSSCYGSVFQRIHSPPCANQELVQILRTPKNLIPWLRFLPRVSSLKIFWAKFTLRWNRRTLIGCLKSCCHFQPKSSSSRAA